MNQEGASYCTSCGTVIALVPDAIDGNLNTVQIDERMVDLLKDYYRSRRGIWIGGALSATMMMKIAWVLLTGFSQAFMPYFLVGLIAGLVALTWGLVKWNDSSSEIKAIERVRQIEIISRSPKRVELESNEPVAIAESEEFTTDRITRNLEERTYVPPVKTSTKV